MRTFCSPLGLPKAAEFGTIRLRFSRFPLSVGRYTVTALLANYGYYQKSDGLFYSINPDVVDVLSRTIEFIVCAAHPAFHGTAVAFEGTWETAEQKLAKAAI
jgi:hypothetical protein